MKIGLRRGIGVSAILLNSLLGPLTLAAHAADWTVIFRASDSKLWNTAAGDESASDGYAVKAADAPSTIHYLRLKRMDTGAAVIVAINRRQILKTGPLDDELIWAGGARIRGANRLLGLARRSWPTANEQDQLVSRPGGQWDSGYRGWGFSKPASGDQTQTYSWEGLPIDKTVFEIAVTADDLDDDEKAKLLSFKSSPPSDENSNRPSDSSATPPAPQAVSVGLSGAGPSTQISKLQTSIEALYVIEQPSGGMLGLASRFILTASPGKPDDPGTVPVKFTTPVGDQMNMVLDDVARAIDVHYGLSGVKKIELSFEDKYDAHDGGSIGAAIGTLMLSMIRGFDIDPHLAITGDVSADAKVHRIGGLAAKLRGAADAGCTLVAVPVENLDQVMDAMVYEGPGIVTNVQVLGISDLDDAVAVSRTDRGADLAKAIDLFREIRESIKDSPSYLYGNEALRKLQQVLALAPNDYSAKALILAAEHKLPRLSAGASEYYTFVAVKEIENTVSPKTTKGTPTPLTQSAVDAALAKLNKLRPIADLTVRPWIDSWIDYIQACNELRLGEATTDYTNEKYQEMMNQSVKLDANQDLSEKLLHEGI
jgi:hypothetical protein